MNSFVKVESDEHILPEYKYLNDQETTGFQDNYSSIGEFDPMFDPMFEPSLQLPVEYDNIPELSLEDIEEITRSLDDTDHFLQGNNNSLGGVMPTTLATQPQFSHEQNALVDANPTMTTTHGSQQYIHAQNIFVDAMPVYATITHHKPQCFQTHYGRPVHELTTDQPQHFRNHYIDNLGNRENAVQKSVNFMGNYYDAKPNCMIPSTDHIHQSYNVFAANGIGSEKNAMNLRSDGLSRSNVTTMLRYEEGVVLRQNGRSSKTSELELEEIRKYFDLPITKAAKELKVGLTVLKKRCRELDIMRWPHRKIKSLQCLIDNVKEMGMTNEKEIEMLEEHKRMLESVPELELSESTKRLRQSCFKANYKKRRLLLSSATKHNI